MFRLQENVPEVYVKESRDFQLMSRLYDLSNNAVRYNIKSMENLLDPMLCSDRLLPLLATRVGFFPRAEYNTHALRLIISVFPYILKHKGTRKGIEMALNTILKAENEYSESYITIENSPNYKITISTKRWLEDQTLLEDVLSYIIPIGYELEFGLYELISGEPATTQLATDITGQSGKASTAVLSKVVEITGETAPGNTISSDIIENAVGSYTATQVLGLEDIKDLIK